MNDDLLKDGASYLISEENYNQYVRGKDVTLGRPEGGDTVVWVSSHDGINEVLIKADGDPRAMEKMLGVPEFSLVDNPIRVDIDNTNGLGIRMPDTLTTGANGSYVPGGETIGGIPERVIYNCPNPDVTPNIGRVSDAALIHGVPTEQVNNLYKNLGGADNPMALRYVNDAVNDIPRSNINENVLIKNIATGKSKVVDAIDDIPTIPGSRAGARVGAVLGVLGAVGDVADVATTFGTAYNQYKNEVYLYIDEPLVAGVWGGYYDYEKYIW